ncbi:hypothetical protein Q1695_003086 [Nippostrongylus brasiliensis]|nr:hypothetical protein Q1695_003085 [Nippostrongylus brasiliensis]WKY11237.1 hypothetical protein Q1695_003086 [Nippostrongylus brasiliensis]
MNCLANSLCDAFLMMSLSMLHNINVYVQSFKTMGEVREEEPRASLEQRRMPSIRMIFDVRPELDRGRYKIPIANEVAVVYVGEGDDVPATLSSAVHHRNNRTGHIADVYRPCDPLLFPRGEPGGDPSITKRRSSNSSEPERVLLISGLASEFLQSSPPRWKAFPAVPRGFVCEN